MDGLVELGVQLAQVVQPEEEKGQDGQDDEDVEQDSAQTDHRIALPRQTHLPDLQHRHQGRHHVQLVGQPDLSAHARLRGDEILGVDLIPTF